MPQDPAAAVLALLVRFPADEVRHALPALVFDLVRATPDVEVPPPVAEAVRLWMLSRKLGPDAPADDVIAALEQTYAARPIQQELRLGLAELLRTLARGDGASAFKSFVGDGDTSVPLSARSAPAGSVKASPLARFALQSKSKAPKE